MSQSDEDFGAEARERQVRFERKVLEAKWFGGTITFGRAGQPGSYTKTFEPMKKMPPEIKLSWTSEYIDNSGYPIQGRDATCAIEFGDFQDEVLIEAEYQYYDKIIKRKVKEYKGIAEKWAMWKWHTQRGTPVDERDKYLTEPNFQPPRLEWAEYVPPQEADPIKVEVVKRGPGRPKKPSETVAA